MRIVLDRNSLTDSISQALYPTSNMVGIVSKCPNGGMVDTRDFIKIK
jgi:hypothetical protein